MKMRETRGMRERGELRDWDKSRTRTAEKVMEGKGFWMKAVIKRRK